MDQPADSLLPVGGGTVLRDKREAGLQLLVFSDKVSPPSLGFLAGYGYTPFTLSCVTVVQRSRHLCCPSAGAVPAEDCVSAALVVLQVVLLYY